MGAPHPVSHRAAIDIGSNSLLLVVVDADGRVVHDEVTVVGLGRGLGERGVMAPDRLQAAEKVLTSYAATARTFGVEPWSVRAVATSAARRALNAETFFARIQRDIGLRVRIVSGEEEALLTWRGALVDLPAPTPPLLVVDLGG
ncbi:MAG: Ppx/GppA family phosphatase, partial [Myxococcales bacterium]|nr:Ppx/GppA family phosphatase [Myxococcales bacterium]